jgi:hypothetical protein
MREFGITLTAKLKHADLFAVAESLGGQSALARYLDVEPGEVGRWINMQSCPPLKPTHRRSAKWIAKLEKNLYDLTHKTLDELFPPELRNNKNFLETKKEIKATRHIPVERLSHSNVARLLLPSPADVVEKKDLQECLAKELAEI